jgi:hypothetical protein
MLLQVAGMRGAVGAEEEPGLPAGGGLEQRLPVHLTLEHRQAVPVRTHPAGEQGVAVLAEQVVRVIVAAVGPSACATYWAACERRDVLEARPAGREIPGAAES